MTAVLQISFQEQADGLVKISADIQTKPGIYSTNEMHSALNLANTLEGLLDSCRTPEKTKHRKRSSKRHR